MLELDPSMKNLLIETIGSNLVADQVEFLGSMVVGEINIHDLSGKRRNFTLSPRMAAEVLIDHLTSKKKLEEFLKLLVEMDDEVVLGKPIRFDGMEYFLLKLGQAGYVYDLNKRKIVPLKEDLMERPDWGAFKQGRSYEVTVASMDIVGSSELVKNHGRKKMEKFFSFFWSYIKERMAPYDGRIWSWSGDGGILAFAFKNHREKATNYAIEIQRVMPLLNSHNRNPIDDPVEMRIALHAGKVTYMTDTGKMISDVINLASHLEKRGTEPGGVSITENVREKLSVKSQELFSPVGDFEGTYVYRSASRLDLI